MMEYILLLEENRETYNIYYEVSTLDFSLRVLVSKSRLSDLVKETRIYTGRGRERIGFRVPIHFRFNPDF